ncbi:MAG: hypothetical protein AAF724_20300 [Pseudomonadota bacterium]
MNFFKSYKDELQSIASIVSIISAIVLIVSVIIAARQFYLTRHAVQAQALSNSLAHGRELYDSLTANPDLARRLFNTEQTELEETLFVQKTLSFFSEQYVLAEAGLMDNETWTLVRRDLCLNYQSPGFRKFAAPLLQRGHFPKGFSEIMEDCPDEP